MPGNGKNAKINQKDFLFYARKEASMNRKVLAAVLAVILCMTLAVSVFAVTFPTIYEKDGNIYWVDYNYKTGKLEWTLLYGHHHKFTQWVVTRMPTCTYTGLRYHTCLTCGKTYWEDIDRLPHSWGGWTIIRETTDHSAGERQHTCRVCGTVESETFYPPGTLKLYDFGEEVKALQMQLHEQGFLDSGYVDGQFGAKTKEAVEAFQNRIGLTANGIAWPQTIDLLRHVFGEWEITKEPTYYEPGIRTRSCTRCSFTETHAYGTKLQQGMYGEEVRQLQIRLKELGYAIGTPDGSYGDVTRRAVRSFQTDQGFDPDGIAWPGVWAALFPVSGEAKPTP